ncbi:DUF1642 domain-containing protein [Listeria monocytogenes]|nr:DUF1642 domain-containing protein [Listeria monocytogenes]EDN7708006.1 DUF1642 domain-containing protein [Listeria monocytogenes]
MRFKKGDKVEFIYGGTLTQGVVNEIRATNHDISYQIVYFGGEKKIWFAERELLSPAPVLKVPQCVADWISRRRQEGYNLIWSISYENNDMPDEMYEWLTSTADNQELFARAWMDGYEIEQEPLFIMPIPYSVLPVHYYINRLDEISFKQGNAQKFTWNEIEKYFPEITKYAVKVEGVAE